MRCDIKDLIGENCITLDNGQRVYDQIHPELVAGRPVEVDFRGVSVCASPFFNAAFGRLLKDLTIEELNRLLKVHNPYSCGEGCPYSGFRSNEENRWLKRTELYRDHEGAYSSLI